jgi:hypothetical protein
VLGGPWLESRDHRFAVFDLRGFAQAQARLLGPEALESLRTQTLAARPVIPPPPMPPR